MGRYLNPGNAGFASIRAGEYVDKSGLIAEVNKTVGTQEKLTCLSRARRFGKSYAAKMLAAYYDRSCDSRPLFDDLAIARDPSYECHLNRYDVIYLDVTCSPRSAWWMPLRRRGARHLRRLWTTTSPRS